MKKLYALIFITLLLSSCEVVKQVAEIRALGECKYSIKSYSDIRIANYDVQNSIRNKEINILNLADLTIGFLNKNIPLQATINLNIYNPANQNAAINQLEFKFLLDDTEFFSGYVNQNITIRPKQNAEAKVNIRGNLFSLLKNVNTITSFLKKNRTNTESKIAKITLKLKPSVLVMGQRIVYPGYITINKEITNKNI